MAIAGLGVAEVIELALLLVAVGALSGFMAGIFGIGGGAVLVPVFYECFRLVGVPLEVRMPLCIGTSLAIIIPTSISFVPRPLQARRGRHGHPEAVVGRDPDRRRRRLAHRALCPGAAVQDRVRLRRLVGGDAADAVARQLEIRRRACRPGP